MLCVHDERKGYLASKMNGCKKMVTNPRGLSHGMGRDRNDEVVEGGWTPRALNATVEV